MSNEGTTNEGITKVTMNLTTPEQKQTWGTVRSPYGSEFSNSAVLYDLVRIKCYEAKGARSNRDRLDALDKEVSELKVMIRAIVTKVGA